MLTPCSPIDSLALLSLAVTVLIRVAPASWASSLISSRAAVRRASRSGARTSAADSRICRARVSSYLPMPSPPRVGTSAGPCATLSELLKPAGSRGKLPESEVLEVVREAETHAVHLVVEDDGRVVRVPVAAREGAHQLDEELTSQDVLRGDVTLVEPVLVHPVGRDRVLLILFHRQQRADAEQHRMLRAPVGDVEESPEARAREAASQVGVVH